jgi:DNA-binding response OmpR family regulator
MGRRRVLVIEDDPAFQELVVYLLQSDGYDVTAIDSALGAAALARRLRPCAILLDLGLPYRSGASLLAELKGDSQTADIPVVVISALPETLTADRRAMAAHVLTKPLQLQELLEAVRAVCAPADE